MSDFLFTTLASIVFFVLGANVGSEIAEVNETERIYEQCIQDNNKLSVVDATALCKHITR